MIRKFRTIEEHNAFSEAWNTEDDPQRLANRLRELFERSRRLAPGLPTGVFKFRNQEEANAWREQWVRERVQRLQRERTVRPSPPAVGDGPDGPARLGS